jgi:hypothetical protein
MAEIQSTLLLKSIKKGCYANYLPIQVKEPFQVRENTRRTILLILKVIPRNSNELISNIIKKITNRRLGFMASNEYISVAVIRTIILFK